VVAVTEYLLRFLLGGIVVSLFAGIADAVGPKSFSGLFGAAPSVALGTLGLALASQGGQYASIEARSMVAGAIALGAASAAIGHLLLRWRWHGLLASAAAWASWLAVAGGLWAVALR
jgi:hypothetical protein